MQGFKSAQMATTLKLATIVAFLVSLSSSAQEEQSATSGLAEFLTTPFIGAMSDKISRRKMIIFCLMVIGSSRGLLSLLPSSSALALLVAIAKGGLLACIRASLADFSSSKVQMATSWARVAVFAALGALLAPVYRGLAMSTRFPFTGAITMGLVGTMVFNAEEESNDDDNAETGGDINPVALTPLSFTRFKSTTSALAVMSTLCSEMVCIETMILATASNDRNRVKLMSIIGLGSIVGSAMSALLQQRFGLRSQSRFATTFQVLSSLSLLGGEADLAAALTTLAKRPSDVSDVVMFEGKNNGERAGALANLKTLGQTCGSITHAFLLSSLGLEASVGFGVLAAIGAEAFRTKMTKQQQKQQEEEED